MPFLVDGNNLLGRARGLSLRDEKSRLELLRRIGAHHRRKGGRYTIFFDGEPRTGRAVQESRLGSVAVRFSGCGVTADEAILKFLRRAAHPREWTVITSDRDLGQACRGLGARVTGCDDFLRQMERLAIEPARNWEKPSSSSEIEEWLKIFGEK